MIRVRKNCVGSRSFGSSLVIKDNLVFGIKENQSVLEEKVSMEDYILETSKNNGTEKNFREGYSSILGKGGGVQVKNISCLHLHGLLSLLYSSQNR